MIAHFSGLGLFAIVLCSPVFSEDRNLRWKVDSDQEWRDAILRHKGLELKEGRLILSQREGVWISKLMRFEGKRKPSAIEIDQSPEWENWEPVENIGPPNLADAPVFLRVAEDNYWMFGKNGNQRGKTAKANAETFQPQKAQLDGFEIDLATTRHSNVFTAAGGMQPDLGGYHAWQSKDMVNWVHHGSITESFAKWMTSAEWVDGTAYFYYDYPNDQDPHVYLDKNLADGKPGENKGLAFLDPSHGSDAGIIRSLDGKFHLIYEDWTPLDASRRSWDSPLAGHAVSDTGFDDFKIVRPAVDHRTKPTGEVRNYRHPHWNKEDPKRFPSNVAEYQVHEPEQPAYGDWAAIAIGGQYYLFGDHDPAGGHEMSVGIFTASGIDQPFAWCGQVGKGHPDPDILFAEGKFYLATQQQTDFVSSGPWVEKVSVRVGVDETDDGKVDQWSDWQDVREEYEGIPGFAKQVARKPAQMNLSKLPAGHGFQVEIKIEDATENASAPVLKGFALRFSP